MVHAERATSLHLVEFAELCPGGIPSLHELQHGHHASVLQLGEDLPSHKVVRRHFQVGFQAANEAGALSR